MGAAEKMNESDEQSFKELGEALSKTQAIAEYSSEGLLLAVNTVYLGFFGYERNEILGKRHSELVELNSGKLCEKQFWEKLSGGEPQLGEFKRRRKNNTVV